MILRKNQAKQNQENLQYILNNMPRKIDPRVLKELTDLCPNTRGYCHLREGIVALGLLSDRSWEQFLCLEIFKYEESFREGGDIGWEEAHRRWVDKGYAERFGDFYSDKMIGKSRELYEKIIGRREREAC